MRGHRHDRTPPVAREHVVGNPDGDLLVVDGIDGVSAGEDAGLVLVGFAAVHVGLACALLDVGIDGFLLLGSGDFRDERVLGSEHHVGGAEERVGTGSENGDVIAFDIEGDFGALGTADPVLLEQLDAFGPIEWLEFVDQALGVFCNAQHPLAQRAAFDGVAFRFPLFDFLVGEDGAEVGRPVDGRFVDEGKADVVDLLGRPAFGFQFGNGRGLLGLLVEVGFVELEENPLGPADELGIGGGDFAVPIVAEAERFQLALEGDDVRLGGDARVLAGLDGILFGGQAEGIPTHRVEDVEALAHLGAADDVGGGVAFGVADVESAARGIGEHIEDEELRLGGIEVGVTGVRGAEGLLFVPNLLPLWLKFVEGEWFAAFVGHGGRSLGVHDRDGHATGRRMGRGNWRKWLVLKRKTPRGCWPGGVGWGNE